MGSWRHVAWPGSDALVWASFRTVERNRSAGGFPPRSLARQLLPYWVVLRLGRGAGLGVSLGRRSRAGSKREPSSRGSSFIELQSSSVCGRSFGIRSSRLPAHLAERICRWRSSAEVGVHVDDRHDFAEGQFYGILHLTSVASICRTVGLKDGQEGPAKGAQAQQRWRSSLGRQRFKQRCRCARSHAPLAARAPFPLQSVAFITPPPPRYTRTGPCSSYRCSGRRDGD